MALNEEFEYYLANQDELVKQHNGKVLVIKGKKIVGVYLSEIEALQAAKKDYEPGSFLIQRCQPGANSHTVTYFTQRVVFG